MTIMRALTIWQPWASLIMAGAKPIEWRGWAAPGFVIGQRIAIRAGARPVRRSELAELLNAITSGDGESTSLDVRIALPLLEQWWNAPKSLPLATVLCTALLHQSVRAGDYTALKGIDSDRVDHAKWGWPLTDIEPVTPMVPARGMQGFWIWVRP